MPNPKTSSQDWFYHAPSSRKSGPVKPVPVASQIPGLNTNAASNVDITAEDIHLRRKWIRDTDSDYVKLAKAGGRKDLFQYREHKPSEHGPVGYPRVDWFDHDNINANPFTTDKVLRPAMPNWYIHDEYKCKEEDFIPSNPKRSLIGFDSLSVWKRDEQDMPEHLPFINKQITAKKKKHETRTEPSDFKLPPLPLTHRDDVEMSHLLSMGYQNDWLTEQEERRRQQEESKIKQRKQYKEKLDRDKEYIDRKKKKEVVAETKPLFKMSKFGNVQSRVDTFRT